MSRGRPASAKRSSSLQWVLVILAAAAVAWSHTLGSLAVLVCYALTCWWWPVCICGRCGGTGKLFAPLGRAFRICPRCHGEGSHVRFGRQIVDWANH